MVCRYQESSKFEKLGYEDDFLRFLQNMISDVEKRIRRGHQRLALNNAQGSVSRVLVWVCLSTSGSGAVLCPVCPPPSQAHLLEQVLRCSFQPYWLLGWPRMIAIFIHAPQKSLVLLICL